MSRNLSAFLIKACAVGVVIAFFIPWVAVQTSLVRGVRSLTDRVEKTFGTGIFGKTADKLNLAAYGLVGGDRTVALSGFEIAKLEKSGAAEMIGGLMTLTGNEAKDPRNVKYLYVVPVFAVALAWLMGIGLHANKLLLYLTAGASLAIAGFVTYKLLQSSYDSEFAQVQFLTGIWATVACFGGMGIAGLAGSQGGGAKSKKKG